MEHTISRVMSLQTWSRGVNVPSMHRRANQGSTVGKQTSKSQRVLVNRTWWRSLRRALSRSIENIFSTTYIYTWQTSNAAHASGKGKQEQIKRVSTTVRPVPQQPCLHATKSKRTAKPLPSGDSPAHKCPPAQCDRIL